MAAPARPRPRRRLGRGREGRRPGARAAARNAAVAAAAHPLGRGRGRQADRRGLRGRAPRLRPGRRRRTGAGPGAPSSAGLRLSGRSAAAGPGPVPRCPRAGRRPAAAAALGAAGLARRRPGVDRAPRRRGWAAPSSRSSRSSTGASRRSCGSRPTAPISTSRSRRGCRYFVDEAMVTARLAERFPDHVPMPLAIEPEHGWLLLPQFDELFSLRAPLDVHREALRRFAGLQRQSSELVDELLADGCLDRRLDVLETQIDPLVNDPEAVARLTSDEVKELRRLAPALKETCRRLAALGLPPTLVHGDLHMLNVARLDGDARLLRLERRVHRPPVHRPALAALGAGRGEPRGVARGLPGALGGGRDRRAAAGGRARSPRSSSRCTTPFPTSTSSPASSPMPSRSWMPRRGSCGASFGSAKLLSERDKPGGSAATAAGHRALSVPVLNTRTHGRERRVAKLALQFSRSHFVEPFAAGRASQRQH